MQLKDLFRKAIRNTYFILFYLIEISVTLYFKIFLSLRNTKKYDNIFIKLDGIGDWIYFQPIFEELLINSKYQKEKSLFIISSKVRPFITSSNKYLDLYFVDLDKISSLSILYIIKKIIYFNCLKTKNLFNLCFWSKFNWCNFPQRIINSEQIISFDCYEDLYPMIFKHLKKSNKIKKNYFNKDMNITLEENQFEVPILHLLNYEHQKLSKFFFKLENDVYQNFLKCETIISNKSNKIAIFPYASTSIKSINPKTLNEIINFFDSCGYEVLIFGSKANLKQLRKINLGKFTTRVKVFGGTVSINKLPSVLKNCKAILSVDSFIPHLMITLKSSPPILVIKTLGSQNKIQEFFSIENKLIKTFQILNELDPKSIRSDIDLILNNYYHHIGK